MPHSSSDLNAFLPTLIADISGDQRPRVAVKGLDLRDILTRLIGALTSGPHADDLYDLGGQLVHIITDRSGALVTEVVTRPRLLTLLADSARMVVILARTEKPGMPDAAVLDALLSRTADFRPLRRIATTPILRSDYWLFIPAVGGGPTRRVRLVC